MHNSNLEKQMSEKLEIFDLDNEPIAIQDRKDYELEIFNESW